jgi:hypothetical protein
MRMSVSDTLALGLDPRHHFGDTTSTAQNRRGKVFAARCTISAPSFSPYQLLELLFFCNPSFLCGNFSE